MKVMITMKNRQDESVDDAAIGDNLEQYTRIRLTSRLEAFDDIVNNWKVFRTVLLKQNVDTLKSTLRTHESLPELEPLPSFKPMTSEITVNLRLHSNK